MTLDARFELFGDPSDLLVAEAVWAFTENHGMAPSWDEAIDHLAEFVPCEPSDADARIVAAIDHEDVQARFDGQDWRLTLDEATADRIARRYMDTTMKRRDRTENT